MHGRGGGGSNLVGVDAGEGGGEGFGGHLANGLVVHREPELAAARLKRERGALGRAARQAAQEARLEKTNRNYRATRARTMALLEIVRPTWP